MEKKKALRVALDELCSAIEDNWSFFGAAAVTAKLRLDEKDMRVSVSGDEVDSGCDSLGAWVVTGCRIGTNASLVPGVRVHPHSAVGSQACLTHDPEASKMALAEHRYPVLPNKRKLDATRSRELCRRLPN